MITALIFAGGTGTRMNTKSKPKQFLSLHGKSILAFTLEHFENHPFVNNIAVVCISGWENYLRMELKRNFISKVKWIVTGGDTVQDSVYNGLQAIKNDCDDFDSSIVLIHDGVRPLIDEKLITANIEKVKEYGNCISVSKATETISSVNEEGTIESIANRSRAYIAKAPQSFYLKDILDAHEKVRGSGIHTLIDSASLMHFCGNKLYTVDCSPYNIKITTPSDYYIFRALYEAQENSQILGI